jgi:hypothetical protein
MREPGYYLILFINEWQPARWSPREDQWEIIGSDVPLSEDEIQLIGPKLEMPTRHLKRHESSSNADRPH